METAVTVKTHTTTLNTTTPITTKTKTPITTPKTKAPITNTKTKTPVTSTAAATVWILALLSTSAGVREHDDGICPGLNLHSFKPCASAVPILTIPLYGNCNTVVQGKHFHGLTLPDVYFDETKHPIPGGEMDVVNYYLLYVYAVHPVKQRVVKSVSLVFNLRGQDLLAGRTDSGVVAYVERFPSTARFVFLLYRQPFLFDVTSMLNYGHRLHDVHDLLTRMYMCDYLAASYQFISYRAAMVIRIAYVNETHLMPEYVEYPNVRGRFLAYSSSPGVHFVLVVLLVVVLRFLISS